MSNTPLILYAAHLGHAAVGLLHRDVLASPVGQSGVQLDKQSSHEALKAAHGHKDRHLPHVPPEMLAVLGLVVVVQAEVSVNPKVRLKGFPRIRTQLHTRAWCRT